MDDIFLAANRACDSKCKQFYGSRNGRRLLVVPISKKKRSSGGNVVESSFHISAVCMDGTQRARTGPVINSGKCGCISASVQRVYLGKSIK